MYTVVVSSVVKDLVNLIPKDVSFVKKVIAPKYSPLERQSLGGIG
jgi:hypothetical protein